MKQNKIIIILYIIISVIIILPFGMFIHWLFCESGMLNFNKQNEQEVSSEYIYDFDKSEYIFASTQNE